MMRWHFGALLLSVVVAAAATASCDGDCDRGGKTCGASVVVTFKQSIALDDEELVFETLFEGRVLRCRLTKAERDTCDVGIFLSVRAVQPDAGPDRDDPLMWPSFVDGLQLHGVAPAQLSVRVQRGGAAVAERSFAPTYTGGYDESSCQTCRYTAVDM